MQRGALALAAMKTLDSISSCHFDAMLEAVADGHEYKYSSSGPRSALERERERETKKSLFQSLEPLGILRGGIEGGGRGRSLCGSQ